MVFVACVLVIVFTTKYGVNFVRAHRISPSTEIVPHFQRDVVVQEGYLTSYHFIVFLLIMFE